MGNILVSGVYYVKIQLPDWINKGIKLNNGIKGVSKCIVEIIDGYVYIID